MVGISTGKYQRAIWYPSVEWAKKPASLKGPSFPKGAVPKHLAAYLFTKGGIPAECARETTGKRGAARVLAMNACVSARKLRHVGV
jgi:hypothetical protein